MSLFERSRKNTSQKWNKTEQSLERQLEERAIIKLQRDSETLNRLRRLNGERESIVYVSPKPEQPFYITISEEIDDNGILRGVLWQGYVPNPSENDPLGVKRMAYLDCRPAYETDYKYLTAIKIWDFLVDNSWRNKGYGSKLAQELLRYAERFKNNEIEVFGYMSFTDIGRAGEPDHPFLRDRLKRFYERNGFTVTSDDRISRFIKRESTK